ncbi:sulfite exporter TauE/SafE family protein [Williamsoniiplasma lucivorax]|uniref:Probable membrane transporter protein n=1 Tax=Williamsoniiplasma lucivorax TaxID=209274 RepID=A0A2S5RDR3_9MOLU|nr:sulfite exporter TauE/SafE family protein [Williamsoniiplasma lucivorax]PPE05438.1 hypothetical protein ELUCI_v1c05300 [Williamsoniiplasma lucivorax]
MGMVETIVLLFFLTLLISFLGSLSGVGGGILYVPLLLLVVGDYYGIDQIKFISTFLVFTSALFNVLLEAYKKNINYWIILLAIIFATPAIFLGQYLNTVFNALIIKIIIIVFLGIVTLLLLLSEYVFKQKTYSKKPPQNKFWIVPLNKNDQTQINLLIIPVVAFCSGIITALTGMGGGPVIMPALILLCYLNMKQATPISHTIIMVSSFVSLMLNYQTFTNQTITLNYLLPLSVAAIGSTTLAFVLKKHFHKEIYIKWLLIILIWASIIKMIVDIV